MRLCVLYGIVLFCFKLNAQGISNVDFKANNNNIEITYDYIKPDDKQYTIDVYLISEKNQKEIKAQYLSGDINPKENGYGKKITWAVINEHININGKHKVQLQLVSVNLDFRFSFNLNGRSILVPPKLPSDLKEEGKVVVEITVDAEGNVIEANPNGRGTSTASAVLKAKAKQAALRTRFNVSGKYQEQHGTLIFVVSIEEAGKR